MTNALVETRLTNRCFQKSMPSKTDAFSVRGISDSVDVRPGIDILERTSSRCQVVVDPVCQAMIDPVSGGSRADVDCESDGVETPWEAPSMTIIMLEKAEKVQSKSCAAFHQPFCLA